MKRYLKELVLLLAVFGGLPFDVASDSAYAQTPPLRVNGIKFSDGTLVTTKYTPEMFGAVGDGVTDDFNAFPRLFNRWRGAIVNNGDNTATFTTVGTHDFKVGDTVHVISTTEAAYDGDHVVTAVPSSTTWKFAISGSPANDSGFDLRCARPNLPRRTIFIPQKTYATSNMINVGDNQAIECAGTILYIGDNTKGGIVLLEGVKDVDWTGGIVDANFQGNANNFAIGGATTVVPYSPNPVAENIKVSNLTVKHSRIATSFESSNNALFSGGGKGVTIQFNTVNIAVTNIVSDDNDIGMSIEGTTSNNRQTPNVVVNNVVIRNAHRTPLFIAGANPTGYTSDSSGGPDSLMYPGAIISGVRVYGGCDQTVNVPGDTLRNNWEVDGVITSNYANGVKISNFVAEMTNRATLIRGDLANTRIQADFYTSAIETIFDGNEIPTLPHTTVDSNNRLDLWVQNLDPAQSFGYVAKGQSSRFRSSVFDVRYRGFTGLGIVQDAAAFGGAVSYDITNMNSPAQRVIGSSDYAEGTSVVLPTSGVLMLNNFIKNGGGVDILTQGATSTDGVSFPGAAWNDRPIVIGPRKLWYSSATGVFRWAASPSSDTSGVGLANMQSLTPADGTASPSVTAGNDLIISYTGATNITGLSDGVDGQIVTLSFRNSNATLVNNVLSFRLRDGVNVTPAVNQTVTLQNFQGNWYEVARNFTAPGGTLTNPTLSGTVAGTPTWSSSQTFPQVTLSAGSGTQTGNALVTIYENTTAVSSTIAGGETDGQSYTMPANTLSANGQAVRCIAFFTHAANANSATLKVYFNGTAVSSAARTSSGEQESLEWTFVRQSSSTMRGLGLGAFGASAQAQATSVGSVNFASSIIIKTTVTGAVADGDITAQYLRCEWLP